MKSDCMVFRANMVSGRKVWSDGTRCSSSRDDGEKSRALKWERTIWGSLQIRQGCYEEDILVQCLFGGGEGMFE